MGGLDGGAVEYIPGGVKGILIFSFLKTSLYN